MSEVRVRFAPSPTGPLHIGGVRTALYNYLFAKSTGGKFILRIEDTDQNRYVPGAEQYIKESLAWLGLNPEEGPEEGGKFAPYKQSERAELYKENIQALLDKGLAYYAFDTPEEIEAMKKDLEVSGVVKPQYNSITRSQMKNSLTLPENEVKKLITEGMPYVIRLKVPSKKDLRFEDMIRGWVKVHSSTLDDKVLIKADGLPTYHLANIVDDHLMEISHVIRGEEWLPSAPFHIYLYECFGWEPPKFAHLPLILKPTGKGKLSKRDSDQHGFPIFPLEWNDPSSSEVSMGFREEGYLPDALINFLAFLGWNPGGEKELFSVDELIKEFKVERIGKGGARFDIEKAKWYNENYLRSRDSEELIKMVLKHAPEAGVDCSEEKAGKIAHLMRERVQFPRELVFNALYMFNRPENYDEKVVRKKWNREATSAFKQFAEKIGKYDKLESLEAHNTLKNILELMEVPMGKLMQALRVGITGEPGGPDLFEIIEVLGPKEVSERLLIAIDRIDTND